MLEPEKSRLEGTLVRLEPLRAEKHAASLYEAIAGREELWTYLRDEPPVSSLDFERSLETKAGQVDPCFLATVEKCSGDTLGLAALMRDESEHRVIEVGNILFGPRLQRTAHATEAMYLMARHVFEDLGYRRYEWKCDALNAPSRSAALRFGFVFEGIFRQHMLIKRRNRDTAWFSMLDADWPACRHGFEAWLEPDNFDKGGRQKRTLAQVRCGA